MTMESIVGKRVLVTGASLGIGRAIALAFAKQDARIGIHYNSHEKEALELRDYIHDKTPCEWVSLHRVNLLDHCQRADLVKEFLYDHQGIDILVNNAGAVFGAQNFSSIDYGSVDRTIELNLIAPFFIAQSAFTQMIEQKTGGRIINISSIAAKYGGSSNTMHYGAAKAGLEAFTIALAKLGARHGILVNAVRPGVTDTHFHDAIPGKDLEARAELIPLKRLCTPEDVAAMCLFLGSDEASYITGQIIGVTGGE